MATRTCTGCGQQRDCDKDFYSGTGRKDGKRSPCKKCTDERNVARVKATGWKPPKSRIFTCTRCSANFHRPTQAGSRNLCDACLQVGRICGRCKEFKPYDRFYPFRTKTKGSRYCLDGCSQGILRERLYGLEIGTIEAVLEQYGGKCGICGATKSSGKKSELHVDHCHQTGKIRGLLCNHCNFGIGHFHDDPDLLMAAIAYLKRHLGSAA